MKRLTVALSFLTLLLTTGLNAQSIDNVKKMYTYERYKTALDEANKIIAATPGNAEAYYWAIMTLLQQNKKDEATKLAATGLTATSNDPLVTVASGTIDLFSDKKDAAKTKFDAAYTAAGKKVKNNIILAIGRAHGSVNKNLADVDYATAKLKEITDKDPRNTEALTLQGDVYRRLEVNSGSKAVPEYMKAFRENPSLAIAAYRLGQIYQTQDNCKALVENYTKAVTADANFMPAWRELFEVHANKESKCYDIKQAEAYLDKYIAAADQGVETDKIKMQFFYFSSQYANAVAAIDAMVAKYGNAVDPDVYYYKALNYKDLRDSVQAKAAFESYFAKQDPTKFNTKQYNRAGELIATVAGKESDAIPYFEKSIALDPSTKNNIRAYNGIVDIYEKQKDYSNAVGWSKKIVDLSEEPSASQYLKLGATYYRLKDYNNAVQVFQQMEAKHSTDYRGPLFLGRSYAALDTSYNGLAIPAFEKYVEMVKNDSVKQKNGLAEAYIYMIIYNANNMNKDKAVEFLQKLKWVDPTNREIPNMEQALGLNKPAPTPGQSTRPGTTKPGTTPAKPATAPAKPGTTPAKAGTPAAKTGTTTTKPAVKTTTKPATTKPAVAKKS